jgi:hypothetical protein
MGCSLPSFVWPCFGTLFKPLMLVLASSQPLDWSPSGTWNSLLKPEPLSPQYSRQSSTARLLEMVGFSRSTEAKTDHSGCSIRLSGGRILQVVKPGRPHFSSSNVIDNFQSFPHLRDLQTFDAEHSQNSQLRANCAVVHMYDYGRNTYWTLARPSPLQVQRRPPPIRPAGRGLRFKIKQCSAAFTPRSKVRFCRFLWTCQIPFDQLSGVGDTHARPQGSC